MNNEEFLTVAATLRAAYPSNNFLTTKDSISVWNDMLKDLDFSICKAAVKEYIITGKYPPTIADIREKCTGYIQMPIADWGEAWEAVLRAIRRFGYMQEIEALESMDNTTRKCVKRIGYQNICMSENITADRANFRQIYETEANRTRQENQLPLQVRQNKQQAIAQLIDSAVQQIEKRECPIPEPKTADMDRVSDMIEKLRR